MLGDLDGGTGNNRPPSLIARRVRRQGPLDETKERTAQRMDKLTSDTGAISIRRLMDCELDYVAGSDLVHRY
jgi:hypothetical protein